MAATSAAHGVRAVRKVMSAPPRHWVGDGFHVYPVFNQLAFSEELSPWLMFDYASPEHFGPSRGKRRGVGQHPHRGFETVTIAFQGEVEHHDSVGNRGVIGPGDIRECMGGGGGRGGGLIGTLSNHRVDDGGPGHHPRGVPLRRVLEERRDLRDVPALAQRGCPPLPRRREGRESAERD